MNGALAAVALLAFWAFAASIDLDIEAALGGLLVLALLGAAVLSIVEWALRRFLGRGRRDR